MKKSIFIICLICMGLISIRSVNAEKIDMDDNVASKQTVTKYIKTVALYDKDDNFVTSQDFEISKREYDAETPVMGEYAYVNSIGKTCASVGGYMCTWSTEYKTLTLSMDIAGGSDGVIIEIENLWKKLPKIKHYDVIGFTIAKGSGIESILPSLKAVQYFDNDTINYNQFSENRVHKSNGEAMIMDIVDSTSNYSRQTYSIRMIGVKPGTIINASYQHAITEDLTKSEAKGFSFGTSTSDSNKIVLGGTYVYPRTLAEKYDQTKGVSLTWQPY